MLSGREHSVWSGLCLWDTRTQEFIVESVCSVLKMSELSDEMIERYLDSEAWSGKSGAFGYQDNHPWLQLVAGTASNVVGLPLERLQELLAVVDDDAA